MDHTGQYSDLTRHTRVCAPIVLDGSFTTTVRLRAKDLASTSSTSLEENATLLVAENPGTTAVTFQVVETSSPNPASGRTVLGSAVTLAPKGRKTVTLAPTQQFIEVRNSGSTEGLVNLTFSSRLHWAALSFAKDDGLYPPKLWKAIVAPFASLA